ncbi:hypothetical protein LTR02_002984 [Friedmanniomyces endolithicus]|nr:hypothetical protein LTR94_013133 [Friedmanniomyces endolithicus]KAK0789716.1 hypothetical protein LTR75_012248 [Friedmanniomyces endolithicus]KAK0812877.1 hypothetical protein LTR59_001254 [Friedmanniomyces endolithicus]KAK0820233.1 hypothetical protein LTR38_000141 [Friedmanniomyces endolithicus]KAK0842316.1 hypothetical protein LTR03_009337 [Friedmanniomyces endolithicus]
MPTYALLGATGSTGSAVLRYLLEVLPTDLTLNIFVRNEDKLLKAFPGLLSTKLPTIKIVQGNPSDQEALLRALENAAVIFQCIATNASKPGVSVAYDTVCSVTDALDVLQSGQKEKYRTPFIVQVRAAPLNPTFAAQEPWLMSTFIHFALYHTYADTDRACKYLASMHDKTPALLDYAFVDTFAVFDAEGTTRTGHELTLTGPLPHAISYADVGAGFCEIAERCRGAGYREGKTTWMTELQSADEDDIVTVIVERSGVRGPAKRPYWPSISGRSKTVHCSPA